MPSRAYPTTGCWLPAAALSSVNVFCRGGDISLNVGRSRVRTLGRLAPRWRTTLLPIAGICRGGATAGELRACRCLPRLPLPLGCCRDALDQLAVLPDTCHNAYTYRACNAGTWRCYCCTMPADKVVLLLVVNVFRPAARAGTTFPAVRLHSSAPAWNDVKHLDFYAPTLIGFTVVQRVRYSTVCCPPYLRRAVFCSYLRHTALRTGLLFWVPAGTVPALLPLPCVTIIVGLSLLFSTFFLHCCSSFFVCFISAIQPAAGKLVPDGGSANYRLRRTATACAQRVVPWALSPPHSGAAWRQTWPCTPRVTRGDSCLNFNTFLVRIILAIPAFCSHAPLLRRATRSVVRFGDWRSVLKFLP